MSKVATRFAPSPTGALHIGGVRTALFNWLFSKNQKGTFHLRIDDTDKERSKDEHKIQIINSLKWIGIEHDGEEYIQSQKIEDHIKIANELLKNTDNECVGLSICLKKNNSCVIKIWNTDSKVNSIQNINPKILEKWGTDIIYIAHMPDKLIV